MNINFIYVEFLILIRMYRIYLFYSRERNRLHAKKTRERKKIQSNALQTRIEELREEVCKSFKLYFILIFYIDHLSISACYHCEMFSTRSIFIIYHNMMELNK